MKRSIVLFIMLFIFLSNVNSQTYQAGSYQILLEDSKYFDITGGTKKVEFKTDKFIVKLKETLSTAEKASFATRHGLTLLSTTKLGISVYQINGGTNLISLITSLCADTDIQYLDLNYLLDYCTTTPYTNDSYDIVWGELLSDPDFLMPYEKIGLFNAWNTTKGFSDVIIGNLDNGIFLNHEDLGAGPDSYTNIWKNMFETPNNGIDDDNNGYIDDYYGWDFGSSYNGDNDVSHNNPTGFFHGTTSAGIMAAKTNNVIGGFGIAGGWNGQGVRIMSVKTSNSQDRPEAACIPFAIEYACENGAKVINMPFSVNANISSIQYTIEYYYAFNRVVFLAAAGHNTESWSNYGVMFPARIECVVAVNGSEASSSGEGIWYGSGSEPGCQGYKWTTMYGPEVDISSPVNPSIQLTVEKDINNNPVSGYHFLHSTGPCYAGTSWSVAIASGVVGLMLSVDPCLSTDEIIEILHNTADKVGGYNYNWDPSNPGHSQEMGFGRINAAAAVAACMPEFPTPITTSLTWNTTKRIGNDLIIESGGELKLNPGSLIRMNPYNKVIVKPGGRLIIDGGTITTTCDNMWQGIEVWGNPSLPQVPSSNQGFVQVINNGTIENALCGIKVYRPDDRGFDHKPGGIAMCNEANFHNNKTAVDIRYLPGVNNVSNLSHSKFLIDYNFLDCRKGPWGQKMYPYFYQHVYLRSVSGIDFYSNNFDIDFTYGGDFPYKGIGINSSNSNFNVLPSCTMVPCEDNPAETNVFTGLEYGIYAVNDLATEKFRAENAIFSTTYIGIYTENIPYAKILKNKFYVPARSTNSWAGDRIATGLYMDASTGYHVEKNEFHGGSVILGRSNIGVYVKNSGPSTNYIYNNLFERLDHGSIAEGYNYNEVNSVSGTGLCYRCNDFYDNGTDFATAMTEKELPNGIKTYQGYYGNDTAPAGNVFSQQPNTVHINNRAGDVEMKYYHHGKSNTIPYMWLIPLNFYNVSVFGVAGVYYDKAVSCKTWIGKPEDPEEKLLSEYNESVMAETQVLESLIVLQDGGSTENTIDEINTTDPNDAFILTEDLLEISPYLSTETLSVIAEDEYVLDNSLVRDILVSNPHAGKSTNILSKIDNRLDPMSDDMYLEILEASENVGPYEQMLESFVNYNSIRYDKLDKLVEKYISEIENPNSLQKLVNLVNTDNSLYADLILLKFYVSKGMINEASSRSNTLISRFSTIDNIELLQGQISEFLSIYSTAMDTNGIDSTELTALQTLIETGEYPVNNWASKLNSFITNTITLESYVLPAPGELQNTRVRPVASKKDNTSLLSIYPNPARDYIIANYKTSEEASDNRIVIRSMEGKILLESNVVGSVNSKTMYLEGLNSGTYIVELISNNNSIATTKLQIIR